MATTNFILKKNNKDGLSPIFLLYQKNGKKFKYYTKVLHTNWSNMQRVKVRKDNGKEAKEKNYILDDLENRIAEIEREAIFLKKNYDIKTIQNKFYISIGHLAPVSGLFALFDRYIQESINIKAPGTIRNYTVIKNKLLEYEDSRAQRNKVEFSVYKEQLKAMLTEETIAAKNTFKFAKQLQKLVKEITSEAKLQKKILDAYWKEKFGELFNEQEIAKQEQGKLF